ncbi:MAG: putative lipase [Planctomycetaceae bacterium]|nr:putative lipase [Planctomycetaceae bacterium]
MFIIRAVFIVAVAVLVAGTIMWIAWSWQVPPTPIPVIVPDERTPNPVIPQPEPASDIEPSFVYLSKAPVDQGRIQWAAVYTLAALAEIAYANAEEQQKRAKAIGAITVQPLAFGSSEGFVASDDRTVVISFRGTQGIRDIVTDTLGFPAFMRGGVVHHGFSRAIGSIYKSAIEAAKKQGALDEKPNKTVWVTGHSLGGAIACGFSMEASKEKKLDVDGIVTFGQPLVMSTSLCQFMLDQYGSRYLRVVNGVDPITTLVNLYRHAGARAQIHDDGEYDWQPPQIATMAPASRRRHPKKVEAVIVESNEDLRLISEEEAHDLDRKIKGAIDGPVPVGAPVSKAAGAFFVDPVAEHYMPGYLSRLREIARRRDVKRTVAD